MAQSRSMAPLAVLGGIFGLYGWAVFATTFHHDGLIGPRYNAPGTDWLVYDGAVQAWFAGNLPLLLDGDRFTAFLNRTFAAWLSGPLPFHPWTYPPHYLLLLLPFGLLPWGVAGVAFVALSAAALTAAVWPNVRGDARRWAVASLILCPAASIDAVTGQNAFLIVALLLAGIALAATRPIVAGTLLAVLSVKPQFWPLAPLALAAGHHRRALAAMTAALLIMVVASAAVFGFEPWRAWLTLMLAPPASFHAAWRASSVLWGCDVHACSLLLGATDRVADALQLAAAAGAAFAVWRAFRGNLRNGLRLPLILAAAALASPHLQTYDLLLLATAATLFLCDGVEHGLRPGDAAFAFALWVLPIFNPPLVMPVGFLTPVVTATFIVRASRP